MKIKNVLAMILFVCVVFLLNSDGVFANNEFDSNANKVISVHENISFAPGIMAFSSISYDHNGYVEWDKGYRRAVGNTQATQGSVKLDSYSRARFETLILGTAYLDSGRVWSSNQGRSWAYSGWELYSALDSGVAKTYYGI